MVDYRGPEIFRSVALWLETPLFHRVVAIHCNVTDIADADIDRQVIKQFKQLEDITFSVSSQETLSKTDKAILESIVPDCRVSSVVEEGTDLRIKTTNGAFAISCAN